MSFDGRRILELGPGPDLGTGALTLARGARSYLAVDLFPLASDASSAFYRELGSALGVRIDTSSLEYRLTTFPAMPDVDGEFDLIVSNATLEHFDDVPATFRRLGELAAPGCLMCHHVDAKTHMRWLKDRDPLNLLRYSASTYDRMSFPGIPNRLRAQDYVDAAAAAGFSARIAPGKRAPTDYLERVRPALDGSFRARGDLDLLSFTLVAERTDAAL